jgi:hypothetical protein
MNKTKFFSSLLVAGLFTVTSVFVSCKDYDDEIKALNQKVDALSPLTDLQDAWKNGIVITNIRQDGKNVVVTTSDDKTYTIQGGQDGANADVWTIGQNAAGEYFWFKNNVITEYPAQGPKGEQGESGASVAGTNGLNGVYYLPKLDGYFYLVDTNTTPATETKTDIQWDSNLVINYNVQAPGESQTISAVQLRKGVMFRGVDGYAEGIYIPTVAPLTSLVFVPQTYYWGIEAAKITRFTPKWYLAYGEKNGGVTGNWLDLISYIDNDDLRKEVIGTKRSTPNPENSVNYENIDEDINVHERYNQSVDKLTIMLNAKAEYHWNPSVAYCDEDTEAKVISANKDFTRGNGNATVSLLGDNKFGKNDKLTVANGILTVPLQVTGKVGTVTSDGSHWASNPGVTVFATQVTYKNGEADTTITSDYAAIVEETVSNLRLSHVKKVANGLLAEDHIVTKLFNTHCGKCTLIENHGYGMHLFATVGEAKYFVANTNRVGEAIQGEGQDLVAFDKDINLTELIETHYTNESGNHAKFDEALFKENFKYVFELTDFRYNDKTNTNESAHAAIYEKDGVFYLHPQDPADNKGVNGRPYQGADDKASEVVVNRIPLVRVSLVYIANGNNKVIDYGYLPIRIVKEVKDARPHVTVEYTSSKDATVTRYNDCYSVQNDVTAYETNWRETEEDLMKNAEIVAAHGSALTHEEFRSHYKAQDPADLTNLIQFYIAGTDATGKYQFAEVGYDLNGNPLPATTANWLNRTYIGTIEYHDNTTDPGAATNTLSWKIPASVIQQLATKGIATVTRAILLKSDDTANYPDIYVVFKSGKIGLEDKTVSLNMNLTKNIIAEYWYESGKFTNGTAEIHTNVVTPEENPNDKDIHSGPSAWKPYEFRNVFSNVFLKNFAASTPQDWLTFEGDAPATGFGPFVKANMKLALVFDEWNAGKIYKGFLDAGAARSFKIKISDDKKTLTATLLNLNGTETTRIQNVAKIVGNWDGTTADFLNLQKMRIELQKTEFAKALLNYVDHLDIDQQYVLNAKVAIVPLTEKGAAAQTQSGNTIIGAIWNAGNNSWCKIEVKDYQFDVRFLRPISIDKTEDTVIEDATSATDQAQVIKLSELVKGYTDFRGTKIFANWKQNRDITKPFWNGNLDYETYYSENDKVDFTINVQGFTPIEDFLGHFISENDNVLTNLNKQNRPAAEEWVKLNEVSQLIDFKITGIDEITYLNNSATVQEFQVRIPVALNYYWGTIYDKVTITVKKTQGSAPRM